MTFHHGKEICDTNIPTAPLSSMFSPCEIFFYKGWKNLEESAKIFTGMLENKTITNYIRISLSFCMYCDNGYLNQFLQFSELLDKQLPLFLKVHTAIKIWGHPKDILYSLSSIALITASLSLAILCAIGSRGMTVLSGTKAMLRFCSARSSRGLGTLIYNRTPYWILFLAQHHRKIEVPLCSLPG